MQLPPNRQAKEEQQVDTNTSKNLSNLMFTILSSIYTPIIDIFNILQTKAVRK